MRIFEASRRTNHWWRVTLQSGAGEEHVELFASDASDAGRKAQSFFPGSRVMAVRADRRGARCPATGFFPVEAPGLPEAFLPVLLPLH